MNLIIYDFSLFIPELLEVLHNLVFLIKLIFILNYMFPNLF